MDITILWWMIKRLKLKGSELILYALIYGFSQLEGQYCNGNVAHISEWTGLDSRTVTRALESLVKKGFVIADIRQLMGVKHITYKANLDIIYHK